MSESCGPTPEDTAFPNCRTENYRERTSDGNENHIGEVPLKIVIIGAGPAGLYAGWRCARLGHEVVLLEKQGVVGGLAASLVAGGNVYGHGFHGRIFRRISEPKHLGLKVQPED
ncbi:MAG: FAD/NAD(P)-binding protein [Candidatus Aminicenantales bacterium]